MQVSKSNLKEFFSFGKSELIRANQDRRHPFRLCSLSTISQYPDLRTVVKRKTMNDLSTIIYTDSRSGKVVHLRANPNCVQLYYNSKKKVQVLIKGAGVIYTSGELYEEHKEIAMKNRSDYSMILSPGSPIDINNPKHGDEDFFCVIHIKPISLEILELDRDQHRRALFIAEEDWEGTWLVP